MNYVVYSHSEFSDILEIQTDYLQDVKDKFLFINKSNLDVSLKKIYSAYKDIIFYDNSKPYAGRILECLDQLKNKHKIEYCIFIHDIDIIFKKDQKILDNCLQIMKNRDIHRIDFQFDYNNNESEKLINLETFEEEQQPEAGSIYIRQDKVGHYVYNVNPSIWNINYFLDLLKINKNLGYRQIELSQPVQDFAKSVVKSHKLYCKDDNKIRSGIFTCVSFFIFFHITHSGCLTPLDQDDKFFDKYNTNIFPVKKEYLTILSKYNIHTKRDFFR